MWEVEGLSHSHTEFTRTAAYAGVEAAAVRASAGGCTAAKRRVRPVGHHAAVHQTVGALLRHWQAVAVESLAVCLLTIRGA